MSVAQYVVSAAAGGSVTCVELSFRSQRHPFGDRRMKAVGWWVTVAALDSGIACAMLAGAVGAKLIDPASANQSNQIIQAILVGALGPLALRSPVRKAKVKEQESTIGITYIYDIARLYGMYALDERFVRLKRNDVQKTRVQWKLRGLDSRKVAVAIRRHLDDHDRLDSERRDEVTAKGSQFPYSSHRG